jgi:carbamate kinase
MIAVKKTAKAIADLIQEGDEIVIVHGNGPQVGMIQNAMTELVRSDPERYIQRNRSETLNSEKFQRWNGFHFNASFCTAGTKNPWQKHICKGRKNSAVPPRFTAFLPCA